MSSVPLAQRIIHERSDPPGGAIRTRLPLPDCTHRTPHARANAARKHARGCDEAAGEAAAAAANSSVAAAPRYVTGLVSRIAAADQHARRDQCDCGKPQSIAHDAQRGRLVPRAHSIAARRRHLLHGRAQQLPRATGGRPRVRRGGETSMRLMRAPRMRASARGSRRGARELPRPKSPSIAHADGHGAGRTRLERHVEGKTGPAYATTIRNEPESTRESETRRTRAAAGTRTQTPKKMTSCSAQHQLQYREKPKWRREAAIISGADQPKCLAWKQR